MSASDFAAAPSCRCEDAGVVAAPPSAPILALIGAPNAGKSTLFNALTGARVKMGNWPGTSVEVARGLWRAGREYAVIDFPGAYSLDPVSPDEELTRELLLERPADERPDLVLVAVDTANIARGLYLAAQVAEHPYRVVVVLTKSDVAAAQGLEVDAAALSQRLGLPVVQVDRVVLHPVAGPLIFLFAMWCVFQITTSVAAPLQDGLDAFFAGPVPDAARALLPDIGWLQGLIVDGLIAGVGMVLTFVPLMGLMFLCLAVLENSGYMARAAVVADRMMRAIGLPGKAFIPLIVGVGCNVPAISATRVLGDPRQRRMTALLVPFTSCSARLTVYVMLAATFFPRNAGTVVFAMYVIGIALVVLAGLAMHKLLWRTMGSDPLVIDLPSYQWPVPRIALTVMWTRLRGFLETAGKIIVATVVVVWALQSTPAHPGESFGEVGPEDSVYGTVSGATAPVFEPAGFGSGR